jgi:hypothetical protein
VQGALDAIRAKRREAHRLPILGALRVASPCSARWDDMKGDERVRFCASCGKNVYDPSEMTSEEAEVLLRANAELPCVRFYRRKDGTILTSDCPRGRRLYALRPLGAAALAVGVAGVAASVAQASSKAPASGVTSPAPPPEEEIEAVEQYVMGQGTASALGSMSLRVRPGGVRAEDEPLEPGVKEEWLCRRR